MRREREREREKENEIKKDDERGKKTHERVTDSSQHELKTTKVYQLEEKKTHIRKKRRERDEKEKERKGTQCRFFLSFLLLHTTQKNISQSVQNVYIYIYR